VDWCQHLRREDSSFSLTRKPRKNPVSCSGLCPGTLRLCGPVTLPPPFPMCHVRFSSASSVSFGQVPRPPFLAFLCSDPEGLTVHLAEGKTNRKANRHQRKKKKMEIIHKGKKGVLSYRRQGQKFLCERLRLLPEVPCSRATNKQ